MWFVTNNVDSHFIETRKQWGAETAQHQLKIIFNIIPFIRKLRYYLVRKKRSIYFLFKSLLKLTNSLIRPRFEDSEYIF